MSGEGSPSLLNLREFRIQRKPSFTHNPGTSTTSDCDVEVVERENKSPPPTCVAPVQRRRILTISTSESDSDCDHKPATSTCGLFSDSKPSVISTVATTGTGPSRINNCHKDERNGYKPNRSKNPSIIEKERQMKYLLELFPNMDAMTIHDVLTKHSFNTDSAAQELSNQHQVQIKTESYVVWREKYENQKAIEKARNEGTFQYHEQMKRKIAEGTSRKKKSKRRKTDCDSDDSTASTKDYKDIRVFDSDEDSDVEISDELTGDKKRVLVFLETATVNELQLMNSCSKKKAEVIVQCRPFKGWIDLVGKLQERKELSTDLLNAAQQVLITRNNVKRLMKKCTSLALQMEKAIAAGAGVKTQPSSLSSGLRLTSYQLVGLNWLVVLHNQAVNGILADEMGLGKTVQVISFLAHLKEIGASKNTHLVIVPSSTLENWRLEFSRWCPEIRVFMYYGSTEERRMFRVDWSKGMLSDFDVILTTYTMVGNSSEERKMFRVTPMHYVVFDEAHMLKNMNTQRYENLMRINAKNRILLTGTPLQNNLLELMSLLIFVMPKMFAEKADDLKSLFQKNSKAGKKNEAEQVPAFEREQIEQAKRIMKPFVLRRLKKDVLKDLPQKRDIVEEVQMAPTQQEQYDELVMSFKNAGSSTTSGYSGMSMMTDLRKLSNHPLLMRYHYDYEQLQEIAKILAMDTRYKDTNPDYIFDDLCYMSDFDIHTMSKEYKGLGKFGLPDNLILTSGKFLYLDQVLPSLKREGHRVLIFSQYVIMLNIMEEYLKLRNHSYLRLDGSTAVSIRQQLIDEYTSDPGIFVFLLSTRAGGLGINLTAADTVIIHDIDFNPYNDKQAEDRCHRMGQMRPVTVYRLISKGTIEEAMLEMNKEKLKLEREITADETDSPDVKSVVRLLSSALSIESSKIANFVSPKASS